MVNEKGINEAGQIVDWDLFDSYMNRKWDKDEWLQTAVLYDPADSICGWCGNKNEFADDYGFIYITPYGDDTRAACENCYHGSIGEMHIKRYGVGDR